MRENCGKIVAKLHYYFLLYCLLRFSNDNDWLIMIPLDVNSTSVVSFERIVTDLDGQFSVEIQYRTLTPRENIILPAIFGVLGLFVIIGGFFIADRIES